MAEESLIKTGEKMSVNVRVETNGASGVGTPLTAEEINKAVGVIIAADKAVETARFNGKKLISKPVAAAIRQPQELIQNILDGKAEVFHAENAGAAQESTEKLSLGGAFYKHLMSGVSQMLPFVIGGGIMIALAFLLDQIMGVPKDQLSQLGSYHEIAAQFKAIGGAAFGFMLPVLAGYIAYFQAFTNTYAPVDRLRALYEEAITAPEIVALSIGTRPDCITPEILDLLEELNKRKPVFIEMGLQTSHDSTASFFYRAYPTETFTKTCHALAEAGIRVTAHIILGLPGETLDMELDTIRYLNTLPVSGIKISMLYVLKNTVLASYYEQHPFHILTMEEYINHLIICLSQLRKDIVIERMTGDGPKDLLIVPKWIGHKRLVLNTIHKEMKQRNFTQGGSLCQKNL